MQRGGNAFDAAIAVAAAEGVLLPMMCGLGGDAFVIAYDAARGARRSPSTAAAWPRRARPATTTAAAATRRCRWTGVHSIGVPGAVAVYEAIWKRYGTLAWPELWAPAIRLAEEGRRHHRTTSPRGSPTRPRSSRASAGPPRSSCRTAARPRPASAGPRRIWQEPARGRRRRRRRLLPRRDRGAAPRLPEAGGRALQRRRLRTPAGGHVPADRDRLSRRHRLRDGPAVAGLPRCSSSSTSSRASTWPARPYGAERIHLLVEAKKLAFADRNRYAGDPAFVRWPLDELISQGARRAAPGARDRPAAGQCARGCARAPSTAATPATSRSPTATATRSPSSTACRRFGSRRGGRRDRRSP